MSNSPSSILLFGCGNMGRAMLNGWLRGGQDAQRFTVVDPSDQSLPEGVRHVRDAGDLHAQFDVIILAIKPQMLNELAPTIRPLLSKDAVLISVLAGSRTETLSHLFTGTRIMRMMPNLAAAIGKSPLGLFSNDLDSADRTAIAAFLAPLGTALWLSDETQMDAVTALAGSGPAFVYRYIDALAAAGTELGLPENDALSLAKAVVEGASLLAMQSPYSPKELAAQVTSPGGTTAAGLAVLDEEDALKKLIEHTLRAARDRGIELSKG